MGAVNEIAISVLICMVITGVLSILVPKSNMEKTMRFVISIFFLLSIVYPFVQGGVEIDYSLFSLEEDIDSQEAITLSEQVSISLLDVAVSNVESEIEIELLMKGIQVEKISIEVNILEDNSIDITKALVYMGEGNSYDTDIISATVSELIGVCPEIRKES